MENPQVEQGKIESATTWEMNNPDDITRWVSFEPKIINKERVMVSEFNNFQVIRKREINQPAERIEFRSANNTYDFLRTLPSDHTFLTTLYPTARYLYKKKQIRGLEFSSIGSILSNAHEKAHAIYHSSLSGQDCQELHDALDKLKEETLSEREKEIIFADERNAWDEAIKEVRQVERELGISIIKDERLVDEFIKRRFGTYEEFMKD